MAYWTHVCVNCSFAGDIERVPNERERVYLASDEYSKEVQDVLSHHNASAVPFVLYGLIAQHTDKRDEAAQAALHAAWSRISLSLSEREIERSLVSDLRR